MDLWEILVPTTRNCGKPFRTRYHRVWDKRVREISGGLTVMSPVKGQWVNPDGVLFAERMIPVRIITDEKNMDKIISMTIDFYDQEAVLAYKISNQVKLVYR
jgi:hypothetical protein